MIAAGKGNRNRHRTRLTGRSDGRRFDTRGRILRAMSVPAFAPLFHAAPPPPPPPPGAAPTIE